MKQADIDHTHHNHTHQRNGAHIDDHHHQHNGAKPVKVEYKVVQTLIVRSGKRERVYWLETRSRIRRKHPNKHGMSANQLVHFFERNNSGSEIRENGETIESTGWPKD
jgi:predicted HD phosphohydrolase